MNIGLGIHARLPDEGKLPGGEILKGRQTEAACGVWFTSTGNVMPKMVKYKNPEGEIRMITGLRVLRQEKKRYCGIPALEFRCSAELGGKEYRFRLYYYMETCCWRISWEA